MKKLSILALTLFAAISMYAASIPEAILALHKTGETMTAEFVEVKTMPKLKKETKKEGKLVFTSPESLRMDYTDPAGDYTLIGTGVFEVSRNGHVQKFPVKNPESRMAVLRTTLLMAFAGDVEGVAKRNNATAEYSEKNGEYHCKLTAEGARQGLSSVELVYSKKTGKLISLTLYEQNGNYTTYKVK